MKHRQKIFISGLMLALFILTTAGFYLADKKSKLSQLGNSQPKPVSRLSVILTASSSTVTVGDKVTVEVLTEGDFADSVSAADLQLSYPAESLKFTDSRPGDIWTKAVKLKDEINPESGTINLSLGRGIGAETTASSVLAIFDFQVLSSSSTTIKLELKDSSRFARLGNGNQPVSYRALPLVINRK